MTDVQLARQSWRRLEPLHGMIYFVPEATERYAALGVDGRAGYFASRAAAFGAASAELVIATFYNFHPALVRGHLPAVWRVTTPEKMLDARLEAADAALRRAGIHEIDTLDDTAELAARAAREACEHPQGRPLFAAHAALPWPSEPLPKLWHAQTLLREFRGDAHVATLLAEGVGPLDALVLHAATGQVPTVFLKFSREWPEEEWAAATERLRERGLVRGEELTDEGRTLRQRIEDRTDELALPAYAALSDEELARLAEQARVFGRTVVDAGLLTFSG
ncbi:SCO6745 family protein [Streptosporangium sp. DT93]|uniref:SCO6745 family protein n=1 Tax=Streptosporangium sp. DT93 TaxID=3393428 RepID=UPI003CE891D4